MTVPCLQMFFLLLRVWSEGSQRAMGAKHVIWGVAGNAGVGD